MKFVYETQTIITLIASNWSCNKKKTVYALLTIKKKKKTLYGHWTVCLHFTIWIELVGWNDFSPALFCGILLYKVIWTHSAKYTVKSYFLLKYFQYLKKRLKLFIFNHKSMSTVSNLLTFKPHYRKGNFLPTLFIDF